MSTLDAQTFWTPEGFRTATGGRWIARPVDTGADASKIIPPIQGVSIDTRSIRPNQAFIAIPGEHSDGHEHIASAVANGSHLLIVQSQHVLEDLESASTKNLYVILVEDTVKALNRLATTYRKVLSNVRVIAVTGSCGKTTTKDFIHTLLQESLRGTASQRSFNNYLGVPLTILCAKPTDQYLIAEIGSNAPGEIRMLADVVQPEIAVVTCIGRSHLEGLGTIEGVAQEKMSLIASLPSENGWAILPADGINIDAWIPPDVNVIRFGESAESDLQVTAYEFDPALATAQFAINDRMRCTIPLAGMHNALNTTAAIAVARRLGLSDETIANGLAKLSLPSMRFETRTVRGVTFINDAYNANPESMLASVRVFLEISIADLQTQEVVPHHVLVLGDMLELGEQTIAYHREILGAIAESCGSSSCSMMAKHLFLVGPHFLAAWEQNRELFDNLAVTAYDSVDEESLKAIVNTLEPKDEVLLKGSRGMALERVLTYFENDSVKGLRATDDDRNEVNPASTTGGVDVKITPSPSKSRT